MKFTLKNIGIIQNAEIELNGLTVITGYNDSGKSTIGKIVFSIIKSIQSYQFAYKVNIGEEIVHLQLILH